MSDWELDSIADNAWSSFDEVAWIECKGKSDHATIDPRMLRGTSFLPAGLLSKAGGESSGGVLKSSDQICQRLQQLNPDAGIKEGDLESQELGYSVEGNVMSPSTSGSGGVWRDYSRGSSLAVPPLSASNRCDSIISSGPEVEPKKETSGFSFEGATGMCKQDSGYHDGGPDIINSSCQFLLSDDICPPGGDLEFLAESHAEVRRDNLLEYGWGNTNNLEDMDNLFSNDGMLWEPPSPTLGDSLESMHQPVPTPVSPKFVSTVVMKHLGANAEIFARKSPPALKNRATGSEEEWSVNRVATTADLENSHLPVQTDNYTDCRNGNTWESPEGGNRDSGNMEDDGSHAPGNTEKCKTSKARRHGPRSKRLEEKQSFGRKLALGLAQAKKSPLMYVPVVSIAQDCPPCATPISPVTRISSSEPMQCLGPVPYVHAGFGFPSHHHLPVVVPSACVMPHQQLQLQGQPVFIGYQPPFFDVPKLQQSKSTFDVSLQSPTASSTMTPQEKIEKLRWRQKMQARLAVEQQQQQLISQRLIQDQAQCGKQNDHQTHPELNSSEEALGGSVRFARSQCAEPLIWNERSVSLSIGASTIEEGDESLAATVLHQLLDIASKMDTRTRLCLRDGFHRLARNAMQRRAAVDTQISKKKKTEPSNRLCMEESSSSSEQSCSRRLLTVDDIVETETNPMDRFIAHLLFHKPSFMPVHMNSAPSSVSETSQLHILHQHAWAWSEANPAPATRSSSVTGGKFGTSNNALEIPASDTVSDRRMDRSALVSGLQLENLLNFSPSQQWVEGESTVLTPSIISVGGVEELTASTKIISKA